MQFKGSLLAFLIAMALCGGALAQDRPLGATRNQKQDLEPLVELCAQQLTLLSSNGTYADIHRRVRNALEVQVSWKAMNRYEEEVCGLIAEELGLKGSEALDVIKKNALRTYFASPLPAELELMVPSLPPYPEFQNEEERKEFERQREVERRGVKAAELRARALSYPAVLIEDMHGACMRHEQLAMIDIKGRLEKELDGSVKKGMATLAKHYTPLVAETFAVPADKQLEQRIVAGVTHPTIEAAQLGFLVRLRALVQAEVHREESAAGDAALVCEAHEKVVQRVCEKVKAAEWWPALKADLAAMLEDPRQATKAISERAK